MAVNDCVLACEFEPISHSQSQARATGTGLYAEGEKDCREMGSKRLNIRFPPLSPTRAQPRPYPLSTSWHTVQASCDSLLPHTCPISACPGPLRDGSTAHAHMAAILRRHLCHGTEMSKLWYWLDTFTNPMSGCWNGERVCVQG